MAQSTDIDLIQLAIREGIQRNASAAFDEMKEQLVKDFEARKNEIVAGIVLSIEEYMSFETINRNLVITVRKIENGTRTGLG